MWFTAIFAITGVVIITLFACRNGVFAECCSSRNHGNGTSKSAGYGIGIGIGERTGGYARDEGLDSSKVSTVRAEPEEEGAYGDPEKESRRSGRLSEDERSQENEDRGGTV